MRFSTRELRDLGVAWLALGLAFAILFSGGPVVLNRPSRLLSVLPVSLLTAGVGFLLHELAHKVVAVRFGQVAEFRADYNMLFLAVVGSLAGFLFAAPGAVYHRGMITERENGLIAVAGPVTNLLLAAVFFPLTLLGGPFAEVGVLGLRINLLLAGFNMLPFGPLDGKKVKAWSLPVFVGVFAPSLVLALWALGFV